MTRYEYTTIWWEGSITTTSARGAATTAPAITSEVQDRFNELGGEG